MSRRTVIAALAVTLVVMVILLLSLAWIHRFQFLVRWPVDPELVLNPSFEEGDFTAPPPPSPPDEPIVQPVDIRSGGGTVTHVAKAAKVLRAGSMALKDWQVSGTGSPPTCSPTKAGLDAIAWLDSSNLFALPPRDQARFIDLTGYCSRPPANFGSVSQVIKNLQAGHEYELSFAVGSAAGFPATGNAVTVRLEIVGLLVTAGQPEVLSQAFPSAVPAQGFEWKPFAIRFTTPVPSITLTFKGEAGGDYVGLDNISLRKVCVLGGLFGCP